jgi:hypothetical protein
MIEKRKVSIIIEDLDNISSVAKSLELLFEKLIYYYAEKDVNKLTTLILSCSIYFGQLLTIIGYKPEDIE